MTNYSLFRRTLRAAVLGNSSEASQLHDQIPAEDINAYNEFVIAMFAGALGVRFEEDQSLDAIRRFADEMRYDYRNVEPPVKQFVVEGLIRGMMGEDHLFDDISADEQLRTQLMAIRKIVGQSKQMHERLDDYLADAETLAKGLADSD